MIHINNGDNSHEWLTEEEFKERFPEIDLTDRRTEESQRLRKIRTKKRITMREMSKLTGLSVIEISDIERGRIRDQQAIDKYIKVLNEAN